MQVFEEFERAYWLLTPNRNPGTRESKMDLLYRSRCDIRLAKPLRRLRSGQLPLRLHARLLTLPLRSRLAYLAHSWWPGARSSVESL